MAGSGHFSRSCSNVISKLRLSAPILSKASRMPAMLTPSRVRCESVRKYDSG